MRGLYLTIGGLIAVCSLIDDGLGAAVTVLCGAFILSMFL